MKKTISLLVAGLLSAGASFAQKGSVLVGGSIGFQLSHDPGHGTLPGDDASQFSIAPTVGYQFANAWTIGVTGGYTHDENHLQTTPVQIASSNTWSAGPFLRYTRPITSWVSVYGQFQATYAYGGPVGNGTPDIYSTVTAQVFPALFFNVKNGFGINCSLGGLYFQNYHISHEGNQGSDIGLSFGSALLIGVSKNFGGHKAG
ncbi:MAG TPA: outer membrane beta-barrel protein [Dinghuibacter sp.]|uniref:outer membrane beta-barrel protein n=1 Tax=Dinghuibacter sp. TaxID=2024697 RepID=UPI002CAB0883|nr:outer membrane beta-barrel protein [Dinghuibacter sp.]HTJ14520.1 outer membrane beta-barrel protein [Dinghuibacter sp.]